LIDEAASKLRLDAESAPPEVRRLADKVKELLAEEDAASQAQDFAKSSELRADRLRIEEEYNTLRAGWLKQGKIETIVGERDIAQLVAQWTGIPVAHMLEGDAERLLHMEDSLHERMVNQEEAVRAVSEAVRRSRAGLKDPRRPIGSFMFLGPTGVGKTELARSLAWFLFGDENAMVRLDMSEYQEKHTVSRLVGAPPGYVGFDEGGQLT
jgi:ATP-dependent Clp protease ATP-binding subunit ClpC